MPKRNALAVIRTEAKRIQKVHPKKKWIDAICEASKRYNRGAVGKVKPKKKAMPKKKSHRVVTRRHTRATTAPVKHRVSGASLGSVRKHTKMATDQLEKLIGQESVKLFKIQRGGKKVSAKIKRHIEKRLTEFKQQFVRLSKK